MSNVAGAAASSVVGELETATDRTSPPRRSRKMVRFGAERKSWLFCSGVKNMERTRHPCAGGVHAEMVHGETPMGERDRILRDFQAGRIRAAHQRTGADHRLRCPAST